NIANPNGAVTSIDVDAEDLVITGAPASGTKSLYLKDLDQVSPYTDPFTAAGGRCHRFHFP
ncbi:MAG: hypothetical protein ABGY96_09105, partial [bacterium]